MNLTQLFGDVVESEFYGIEDPELEMLHFGLLVDHPDDLDGNEQKAQLDGKHGRKGIGKIQKFIQSSEKSG